MNFKPGQFIKNTPIDVCFIGSCTNGRISDLRVAAKVVKHSKVAKNVKAFVVPGSEKVAQDCLLYTSPSPRDYAASRMPSSA